MTRWARATGALVATLAVLGILTVIALISIRYHYTWDLTANRRQSLSEESRRALARLPRDVTLLAFYLAGQDQEAKDLLTQYANASSRVRYELIDPQREPAKARDYRAAGATVVVLAGDKRELVSFPDEERLTNAILKAAREGARKVYFATGHGERGLDDVSERGLSRLKSTLEDAGYAAASLNLAAASAVPDDADALVMAGPRADLLKSEAERLQDYLRRGGHLLVLADLPDAPTPELAALVQRYGIDLPAAVLVEPNVRLEVPDPRVAIVEQFGAHPVTSGLDRSGYAGLMPIARPVIPAEKAPEGVELTWLARTTPTSWASPIDLSKPGARVAFRFDPRRDRKGPVTVAVAATFKPGAAASGAAGATPAAPAQPAADAKPAAAATAGADDHKATRTGRLVVVGDADFASNQFFGWPANRELVVGAVSWLASEEAILSIAPRSATTSPLLLTPGQSLVALIVAFVLPLGVAAAGVATWLSRRRRHA